MELETWQRVIAALITGMLAGAVAWLLGRASLFLGDLMRRRLPTLNIPATAGDAARRTYRGLGRVMAVWLSAICAAALSAATAWFLMPAQIEWQVATWAWIIGTVLVIGDLGLVAWFLFKLFRARRIARYDWAAHRAVGGVLDRLCLAGYRVFHEVRLEGVSVDHVVLGEKGVFALKTVARVAPKSRAAAKLENGKLAFSDGHIDAFSAGEAARNLGLLSGALTKILGHRANVRSVLALPGWQCRPDGAANHLLLNESNLVTLPSWNTPDAFLMNEDLPNLEAWLAERSSVERLD